MGATELKYTATLDRGEMRTRLVQLMRPDAIVDGDLESRIGRLHERFRAYSASFPLGLWAPGLVITREMRVVTEAYLPLAEIRAAFRRLLKLSLHYAPFFPASAIEFSAAWLDVLHHLHPLISGPDPSCLLRRLMADPGFRCRFLFALFLPRRYGGSFVRYPLQASFLNAWLRQMPRQQPLKCLDAACGSGEGTYELALLLRQRGFFSTVVQGVTIDPLELFAAAHAFFPHDPERQARYRQAVREVFTLPSSSVDFGMKDLRTADGSPSEYDVILCNGLLGGPLLNEREDLAKTMGRLCRMLKQGGVLLAADRFHQGWKRTVTDATLRQMLAENGLTVLSVGEGVAGVNAN